MGKFSLLLTLALTWALHLRTAGKLHVVAVAMYSEFIFYIVLVKALLSYAHYTRVHSAWRLVCFIFLYLDVIDFLIIHPGDVVGDWCPFPPILGPLILGNLAPPEKVSTFPVRSKGSNIEVFIDRYFILLLCVRVLTSYYIEIWRIDSNLNTGAAS